MPFHIVNHFFLSLLRKLFGLISQYLVEKYKKIATYFLFFILFYLTSQIQIYIIFSFTNYMLMLSISILSHILPQYVSQLTCELSNFLRQEMAKKEQQEGYATEGTSIDFDGRQPKFKTNWLTEYLMYIEVQFRKESP